MCNQLEEIATEKLIPRDYYVFLLVILALKPQNKDGIILERYLFSKNKQKYGRKRKTATMLD